jgi:very-short-patch-repair endonuclease
MSREPDTDARIQEIASRQQGVVARRQLLHAGVSGRAIEHRVERGRLVRLHRGVYRVGPITGRYHREMAAVLACGDGASLSHDTAAAILDLGREPQREAPIHVTGPRNLRGPRSGVRLHRVTRLEVDEIERRHGLPLTTPARTLLDLASCRGPEQVELALARAERRKLVTVEALELLLARYPGRAGTALLRRVLGQADGPALTRSKAERMFLALIRRCRAPRPRTNVDVRGYQVDFLWPEYGLIVEIDGFAFHSGRSPFEDDRARDSIIAGEGLRVVRFTWRRLVNDREALLLELGMALGAGTRGS